MADDDFAIQAETRVQETGFTVAVGGLVEIHEIHVDLSPRQVAIKLRVQVQEWLFQGG